MPLSWKCARQRSLCTVVAAGDHVCDLQPCLGTVPAGLTLVTSALDRAPAVFRTSHFWAYIDNSHYENHSIKYAHSNFSLCHILLSSLGGSTLARPSMPHLRALASEPLKCGQPKQRCAKGVKDTLCFFFNLIFNIFLHTVFLILRGQNVKYLINDCLYWSCIGMFWIYGLRRNIILKLITLVSFHFLKYWY